MGEPIRILVTGEHEDLEKPEATSAGGRPIEWIQLPVLRFERIPVDAAIVEDLVASPVEWILFTSQRAVRFWSELLLETNVDFPLETQVACIGERTAEYASQDGFTPDFYPTEPGTEKFLEEFRDLLSNNTVKPRVVIPMAEGGRTTIRDELAALGCKVISIPLYRTLPLDDIPKRLTAEELSKVSAILFTSPSSVDAFTKHFQIPKQAKVVAIGQFTGEYLEKKGLGPRLLPEGDFQRIGEVL